jgi:NHL repeat
VNRRGVIRTAVGDGLEGDAPSVVDVANARFRGPRAVAVDTDGSVLVADERNNAIRRTHGAIVSIVASPAGPIVADLDMPSDLIATDRGIYVANTGRHQVLLIHRDGHVELVAGSGRHGFSGDGGPATAADLDWPLALALASDGSLYILDRLNRSVRRVAPDGTISTVINHVRGLRGGGVAVDRRGGVLATDTRGILRLGTDGAIRRLAGRRGRGFNGDRGRADKVRLSCLTQLAVDRANRVLAADSCNDRIRRVARGRVATIAGSGIPIRVRVRVRPRARASKFNCASYNPRFQPFGFQPLAGGALRYRSRARITFIIVTARVARVTVKVVRQSDGRVLRRRTRRFQAGVRRRMTVRRPSGRARYTAVAEGIALHQPLARRCDRRNLRLRG